MNDITFKELKQRAVSGIVQLNVEDCQKYNFPCLIYDKGNSGCYCASCGCQTPPFYKLIVQENGFEYFEIDIE